MRDLILMAGVLAMLPAMLMQPAAGLLVWCWFTIMNPHREVYSFAAGQPFNLVIAIITLGAWLASRERKRWTPDIMPKLMLVFLAWVTLNACFAPFPDWSWPLWTRTAKVFVFVFLALVLLNTKARIHAMIWVVVVSIGYYGVKGGFFTIRNGGFAIVYGPEDTMIADNNQLAVAVVMTLPLVHYLRMHTRNRWLRLGLLVAFLLQIVMVFGSYSRGGVLALASMLLLFWLRSDRKIAYAIAGSVAIAAALSVMPDSFFDRMNTIGNADQDSSFLGRVMAWKVATFYATDHFPFGAGFSGPELGAIWFRYFPGTDNHAAHSIFFQVLGEQGFPGLALYLLVIGAGLRNNMIVIRQTRRCPELRWAFDLARMSQVALVSFCIGASAVSMAYWDEFLLLLAIGSVLREITSPERLTVAAAGPLPLRETVPAAALATRRAGTG